MGMINYLFVCFSLPDPKIKTEHGWAEQRKKKKKKISSFAQIIIKKTEIKLPTVTMKYGLYVTSVDILGRGRSFPWFSSCAITTPNLCKIFHTTQKYFS